MKRKKWIFLIIGCALLAFLFPLTACKHDNYFVWLCHNKWLIFDEK